MSLLLKKITPLDLKKNGIQSVLTNKFVPVTATTEPVIDGEKCDIGYLSINNIVYGTDLYVSEGLAKQMSQGYKVLTDFFTPKFIFKDNVLSPIVFTQKTDAGYQVCVRLKYNVQPECLVLGEVEGHVGVLGAEVNFDKIFKKGDVLLDIRPTISCHLVKI